MAHTGIRASKAIAILKDDNIPRLAANMNTNLRKLCRTALVIIGEIYEGSFDTLIVKII